FQVLRKDAPGRLYAFKDGTLRVIGEVGNAEARISLVELMDENWDRDPFMADFGSVEWARGMAGRGYHVVVEAYTVAEAKLLLHDSYKDPILSPCPSSGWYVLDTYATEDGTEDGEPIPPVWYGYTLSRKGER